VRTLNKIAFIIEADNYRSDVKIELRFKTAGPLGEKMQTLQFNQNDAFTSSNFGGSVFVKTSSSEMRVDCYRVRTP
jgi:hypothetical protein